jgi:hypothetical protein
MNLNPPIYDYLAWGLIAASFFIAFKVASMSEGPTRGYAKLAAWTMLGSGFILLGITGVLANHRTPLISRTGEISYLIQHHGRNSGSTLRVQSDTGETPDLNTSYDGHALLRGETVQVQYQEYSSNIQHLQILNGPYLGTTLAPTNSTGDAELAIFAGIAALCFGLGQWLVKRNGEAPEPQNTTTDQSDLTDLGLSNHNPDQ